MFTHRLEAMENRIASFMWCLIPAPNFGKATVEYVCMRRRHINLVKILLL